MAWDAARAVLSLAVPVYPTDAQQPFGPRAVSEVALSVLITTSLCSAVGFFLTRSKWLLVLARHFHKDLREEALEEEADAAGASGNSVAPSVAADEDGLPKGPRHLRKRTAQELIFIAVHNSAVAVLAALAWLIASPSLALHAFTLEVAYEFFDTVSLGFNRLEPETLIHHIVSPICILCSTQTDVDYRVLCHLCVCIDSSGAVLGYSKFLLRYSHKSAKSIYQKLVWVHGILRVLLPLIDTVIIMHNEVSSRGAFFSVAGKVEIIDGRAVFGKTDWTHMYFWAIAVLDAFNCYFFYVIRARARLPASLCTHYEVHTGCH